VSAAAKVVRRVVEPDGSLVRLVLDRPKGNILDAEMMAALRAELREVARAPEVRTLLFEGSGAHFSFGASVEEHRPARVAEMLGAFHALFRELAASRKVLVAAVRGNCLGGGLELAAYCHRVFASRDAKLGNPEIKLGVFAPVASLVLPERMGRGRADELLLSGRTLGADEACAAGLVDHVADDPSAAALAWHAANLASLSASSLGFAVEAARYRFDQAFFAALAQLERRYLEGLMRTHDAGEGLEAFLAKRAPTWKHR
jgi:cyclohexa-1,5-dienecarbonyl-CoA hydratase